MKIGKLITFLLLFSANIFVQTQAQNNSVRAVSASNFMVAQPVPDRTVYYNLLDTGVYKPITWGLDLAWLSEENIRRGIAFMGADRVDVIRASFMPTDTLKNGDLSTSTIGTLNTRLNLIDLTGKKTKVILNCDHPTVNSWYLGKAARWAQLIDATTKRVQARGRDVETVSPFNEPDFGWGQFTGSNGMSDFYNIAVELKKIPKFDTIRISGGNTLNCDQALNWYNYLKPKINEGNTHQLAGVFDNYANFFKTVRANGHHATADELHNVMEAMVGVEYGMQSGIWWGTAELARGEFVKASDGKRLGYAEHRPNWTAASVYRTLEGKIQAFGGTSERQAATTSYRFVSKDRNVYYDGYGPQREYTMTLPGGTGYQTGQTNAERVVNVTYGNDIQPTINGKYILVNRNSGKVIVVTGGVSTAGAGLSQNAYTGATYQQWNVTPVDSRIGGDFSYFTMTAVHSAKAMDVLNYSLVNGSSIIVWDDAKGGNQQWYFDYKEDGWFYIRSRHSNKCLEVNGMSLTNGAGIVQNDKKDAFSQQWRLIPVGAQVEFVNPAPPTALTATANASSIRLDWKASIDKDVANYVIYRADSVGGVFNTIARNITTTAFVDNTTLTGKQYTYKVKAIDNSLNKSIYSAEVSASATGDSDLVAWYNFDGVTTDSTLNLNHAAGLNLTYGIGKSGKAAVLNGTTSFLQLPYDVANHKELSFATWIYWKGIATWQRIFDFGNDQSQYMFLTPRADNGQMRFAIKNGGVEQILNTTVLPVTKWTHLAFTMGKSGVRIYVNGVKIAESTSITFNPMDFKPSINYIGRSQFADPLLNANLDDVRIYNYELSAIDISRLAGTNTDVINTDFESKLSFGPVPSTDNLTVKYADSRINQSTLTIYALNGKQILNTLIPSSTETKINVAEIPSGIYLMKLSNEKETINKKLIITH